ncbi:MAG: hypothetical protein WC749_08495 [Dehalococcoidia bacterium]
MKERMGTLKNESGSALVTALIMLFLGSVILVPLMSYMDTGIGATEVKEKKMNAFYAANAGVEDALNKLRLNNTGDGSTFNPQTAMWQYDLNAPINNNTVAVTITREWLLTGTGITEPVPPLPQDTITVTGSTWDCDSNNRWYRMELSWPLTLQTLRVSKISVWLPAGFAYDYDVGSVHPDSFITTDPARPPIDHHGGTILEWDLGNVLLEDEDIDAGITPACAMAFKFRPAKDPLGAFCWVTSATTGQTLDPALYQTVYWDTECSSYEILSTATNLTTGELTQATAYSSRSRFSDRLNLAHGDYRAIGNSLMADTGYRVGFITITNGGSGYTSAPTVGFSDGGGSGATATASRSTGNVTGITLTNGGSGYTSTPTVTLTGGGGSGAVATATLAPAAVGSITMTNGGSGYTSAPTVAISGGGGSGAAATATLVPTTVGNLTLTSGGSGYTSAPTVGFSGGGGSGATATATIRSVVNSVTVIDGGSSYTSAPFIGFSGGSGSGATATASLAAGAVASVTVTSGGFSYNSAPTVTISGGGGSGATATATIHHHHVEAVTVTSGGSGYTSAPTVSFSGGSGWGATATASLAPRAVASVTVTNEGSGYTSAPTVTLTGGGGSGATATSTITGIVYSITRTNGGSGYTSPPTVTFTGGGGTGAAATAALAPSAVAGLTLTNGGSGYSSAPTVSFSGGGGSGAAASATLPPRSVAGVIVTNGGSNYSSAPTVGFGGGGGSGAAGTATILGAGHIMSVTINNKGSGYTSAPFVQFSGGGGSGATATATLEGNYQRDILYDATSAQMQKAAIPSISHVPTQIPQDATVVLAYLYWGGFLGSTTNPQPFTDIKFCIQEPSGTTTWYTSADVSPNKTGLAELSGSGWTGTYYYSCRADVTALLGTVSDSDLDEGIFTFTVGDAHPEDENPFGVMGGWTAEAAWAGWSLMIIYSSPSEEAHQVYLYDTLLMAGHPPGHQGTFSLSGFKAPDSNATAYMTYFAGEGDRQYGGHQWDSYATQTLNLADGDIEYMNVKGLPSGQAGYVSEINGRTQATLDNTNNNIFNSQSYFLGMGSEAGFIDGVDFDTYDASSCIQAGDTGAEIRYRTSVDGWCLLYLVMSFRSDVAEPSMKVYPIGLITYDGG